MGFRPLLDASETSGRYLEHLLVAVSERVAGQLVGAALTVRPPGDAGLSLGLQRNSRLVENR